MRIVVAGGTGFLGTPLVSQLRATGNEVFVLTRGPATAERISWVPDGTIGPWAKIIDGSDAVVNLSGESIAQRRWTSALKHAFVIAASTPRGASSPRFVPPIESRRCC